MAALGDEGNIDPSLLPIGQSGGVNAAATEMEEANALREAHPVKAPFEQVREPRNQGDESLTPPADAGVEHRPRRTATAAWAYRRRTGSRTISACKLFDRISGALLTWVRRAAGRDAAD